MPILPRLEEALYKTVLQSVPIVCADVAVIDRAAQKICLAQRVVHPCPGWWVIGGRQLRGQTSKEAALAHLEHDTGVKATADRLQFIAFCDHIYAQNAQGSPGGTHTVAPTYAIELTPEELAPLLTRDNSLREEEYAGRMRWFNRKELQEVILREEASAFILETFDLIFPPT